MIKGYKQRAPKAGSPKDGAPWKHHPEQKMKYQITKTENEYKITDEYGTNYGEYQTKEKAERLINLWNGEIWDQAAPVKVEYTAKMYGDDGIYNGRDTNNEGEPED